MGYYVSMGVDVKIPKEKVEAALKVLNEWVMKGKSWVHPNPSDNIVDQLRNCRYEADEYDGGNIHIYCFNGEKWGDDEELYYALAPFVEDDGCIEITGEEGEKWRYLFNDGKIKEEQGTIVWE